MANVTVAIKPKYVTRKAIEKPIFNEGNFLTILDNETASRKVLALLNTSHVAIVSDGKYYPVNNDNYEEQYALAIAGETPTVEEEATFGVKKINAFVKSSTATVCSQLMDNTDIYNGIVDADLFKVTDLSKFSSPVDKKGYWLVLNVDLPAATAEGYSDLKFFDGTSVVNGDNFIHITEDEITTFILAINGKLTVNGETGDVEEKFTTRLRTKVLLEADAVDAITADGVAYDTLQDAFDHVTDGGTVKVSKPITVKKKIVIQGGKTVNLQVLANITFTEKYNFEVLDGTLNITGTATITQAKTHVVKLTNTDETKPCTVTVGAGITMVGGFSAICDVSKTKNAHVTSSGILKGYYYGLGINGSSDLNTVVINGGALIGTCTNEADEPLGCYLAAPGNYNISNCLIESCNSGIEIRAGKLVLNNCTINGNGTVAPTMHANGSGSTSISAGVAIAQHTTMKPINVYMNDCTIKAQAALLEGNPQNNPTATVDTKIFVNDSVFIGAIKTMAPETDCSKFLNSGRFTVCPDDVYIADGYEAQEQPNGNFDIVKA